MNSRAVSSISRQLFFGSYKNFIDMLMYTSKEPYKYEINISYDNLSDGNVKLNICIRSEKYNRRGGEKDIYFDRQNNNYIELSNCVVLTKEDAQNLIRDIRSDFEFNHYVAYASLNKNNIQTLENTKFILEIALKEEDIDEALEFNSYVNTNERHENRIGFKKRQKVLAPNK